MSGTLQATILKDGASSTNNLTFDSSGNVTVGNNLTVTGTTTLTGSLAGNPTTTGTYVMGSSFLRNRIINGNMTIDQRNSGAQITAANLINTAYMVDRWAYFSSQAAKFTAQQNAGSVTTPVGFPNYLGMTVATAVTVGATDFFNIGQSIEGFNFADLAWGTANAKTVTLSFVVYSSLTGTFGGVLRNSAVNRSYPFTYSIPTANTWTTISVTIAGDTSGTWVGATNGIGVQVLFGLGVGTTYSTTAGAWAAGNYLSATGAVSVVGTASATFYITGVQLEVGTVATPFERRQYGQELALCQRYYEKSYAIGTVPGSVTAYSLGTTSGLNGYSSTVYLFINVPFKVTKRTAATFAYWDAAGNASRTTYVTGGGLSQTDNNNNVSFATGSETGVIVSPLVIPSNNCLFNWTASAEL